MGFGSFFGRDNIGGMYSGTGATNSSFTTNSPSQGGSIGGWLASNSGRGQRWMNMGTSAPTAQAPSLPNPMSYQMPAATTEGYNRFLSKGYKDVSNWASLQQLLALINQAQVANKLQDGRKIEYGLPVLQRYLGDL